MKKLVALLCCLVFAAGCAPRIPYRIAPTVAPEDIDVGARLQKLPKNKPITESTALYEMGIIGMRDSASVASRDRHSVWSFPNGLDVVFTHTAPMPADTTSENTRTDIQHIALFKGETLIATWRRR